uniref:TatD DNase domain containing 3 n=1 Tax=Sinocyclocheilus rhinocerous TaxID=307959 RepID=A0A673LH66_9TELE
TNIMARVLIDCHCHLLANDYPGFVFPCFGIHPLQGSGQDLDDIVAVGVTGLDFTPWFANTTQEHLNLPLNVHSRSAAKVAIATMKELGIRQALLHNFASKPSVAMEGVQAGFFFSFLPAISKNEQSKINQIPLEHICLETDSPALGTDKHVRSEPGNIMICCEHIAKVKGISPEVMEVTTQNALRLFSKLKT